MRKSSEEHVLEWSERIKNQKLSNQNRKDWCREQGISYNTFQYWYYKLNEKASKNPDKIPFLEIPEEYPWIEVSFRGAKIILSKDFDRSAFLCLVRLLKEE
jgi:hypothetical protein